MRRLRWAILLAVIALSLAAFAQRARAWSAGIWYVGIVPTPDHHGDLAERAVRCLDSPQKLFPPGCRSAIPVDLEFFIGQLRRGSQMPDLNRTLGDGLSSSLHSLNPRYNAGLDPSIRAAHGIPVGETIVPGKADFAIDREITAVKEDIRLLRFDCRNPDVQGYSWLWRDLGRLSHYIADIHSPFHPNSFGIAQLPDDYHEGAVHPRTGLWFKGLWDQGRPGQLEHFRNETLKLGLAADIPNIPCGACSGPPDPVGMARQAQETMDAYVSASDPNERGYFGLMVDFFHNQFNDGQIRSWGRPRAAAAIGSMMAVFRDALGS